MASGVRSLRILLIQWSWKFADLQRDCTWGVRDISLSNSTPRFRAEVVDMTSSVSTLSVVYSGRDVLFLLVISINSVLLPLSLSLFTSIQCLISQIHCSNLLTARSEDAGSLWSIPCLLHPFHPCPPNRGADPRILLTLSWEWTSSQMCVVCTIRKPIKIKNICHMMHFDSGSQHTKDGVCIGMLTIFKISISWIHGVHYFWLGISWKLPFSMLNSILYFTDTESDAHLKR